MVPDARPHGTSSLGLGPRAATGRRTRLAAAAVAVVALGLGVTRLGSGAVADGVGAGLYAVLAYLLVALVLARARATVVGLIALGLCVVVELTQLTGASAEIVGAWGPARYVLGTTFQAVDLAAYAAGAGVAVVVDRALSARSRHARAGA